MRSFLFVLLALGISMNGGLLASEIAASSSTPLVVAGLGRGPFPIIREKCSLNDFLTNLAVVFEYLADNPRLELKFVCDKLSPLVKAVKSSPDKKAFFVCNLFLLWLYRRPAPVGGGSVVFSSNDSEDALVNELWLAVMSTRGRTISFMDYLPVLLEFTDFFQCMEAVLCLHGSGMDPESKDGCLRARFKSIKSFMQEFEHFFKKHSLAVLPDDHGKAKRLRGEGVVVRPDRVVSLTPVFRWLSENKAFCCVSGEAAIKYKEMVDQTTTACHDAGAGVFYDDLSADLFSDDREGIGRKVTALNVNVRDPISGDTLLHDAVVDNRISNVIALLKIEGIQVNSRNWYGNTPLHLAARCGHEAIVDVLLLEKDIDLMPLNRSAKTPLHYAAQYGRVSIFKTLLDKGVEVNGSDIYRNSLAHAVVGAGSYTDDVDFAGYSDAESDMESESECEYDVAEDSGSDYEPGMSPESSEEARLSILKILIPEHCVGEKKLLAAAASSASSLHEVSGVEKVPGFTFFGQRNYKGRTALEMAVNRRFAKIADYLRASEEAFVSSVAAKVCSKSD